ncbi:MAG: tetraacyldisaccharide 4'-kinase [Candidatus Tectomicrobia bacterium]|nr:tetraacyldisaccharide 4'-kinase [Candidatus Tectomicrobia bacterium]
MEDYWASAGDGAFRGRRWVVAKALRCAAGLYRLGWRLRQAGFRSGLRPVARLPCRVVSVGNLTVGGTGKTPMTGAIAALLQARGRRVVVISRGYRGRARQAVHEVSNGAALLSTPELAGDEAFMLARQLAGVPVLVGARRAVVGRYALRRYQPDVLVLDDGYQHQQLHRDVNLLLVSADAPLGNGCLLPRGPLREPLAALRRADGVLITALADESSEAARRLLGAERPDLPLFVARYEARDLLELASGARHPLAHLTGASYVAFCGLARPARFRASLARLPGSCLGLRAYPDHHAYGAADLALLTRHLRQRRGEFLLTTEKDAVKIEGLRSPGAPILVLRMEMRFEPGQPTFEEWLLSRLPEAG